MSESLIRYYRSELRSDESAEDKRKKIIGRPIVYSQSTDIGGWYEEEIAPGALDGCDLKDVCLFVNHEGRMIPIARHRDGKESTMQLSVDDNGLSFVAYPDVERNMFSAALYSSVDRGDIDGMSMRMWVSEDRWERHNTDYPKRIVLKISKIDEVSAVNHPAYSATEISTRSERDSSQMPDELRRALDKDTSKNLALLKAKIEYNCF